jgi:signal transduction histidine kinase
MYLIELKKSQRIQHELRISCESKSLALEQFAYVAAHDLKSPLANISSLIKLFEQKYNDKLDAKGQLIMQSVFESSEKLRKLIDGLLKYSKTDDLQISDKAEVDLNKLCDSLSIMLGFKNDLKLQLKTDLKAIYVNPTVIDQILINLITNAIKYCDKSHVDVELAVAENDTHYLFSVKDNGPGIAPKHHDKIFNIFEVMALKDKNGQRGNGIGLASVKKIVEKCKGEIKVESDLGKGSNFIFSLAK